MIITVTFPFDKWVESTMSERVEWLANRKIPISYDFLNDQILLASGTLGLDIDHTARKATIRWYETEEEVPKP